MGNSPTPPGLLERIMIKVDERIAAFARSGFLRNATITEGGLTIRGGFLRLRNALNTFNLFYVGPVAPSQPDGTPQQGWVVRRADGTTVLLLRDAFPEDGPSGLNQALTWLDRAGNTVLSDDTDSGQGLARPYVGTTWARARFGDWAVSTTSSTFETLWRAELIKQHPRLSVATLSSMDTSGATGEVRVLVNGIELAPPQSIGFSLTTSLFGPENISGAHMELVTVEVQARQTSASGAIRVEPLHIYGRQS